jgi:hypothetical protein
MWWLWGEKPKRKLKNHPLRYPLPVYTYTPRRKPYKSLLRKVIGLCAGLFFIGLGFHGDRVMEHLRVTGQLTSGVITDKIVRHGRNAGYGFSYHFTVDGTAFFTGSSDVDYATFQTAVIGDTIPVLYLPDDPTRSELESYVNHWNSAIPGAGIVGLSIAFVVGFLPMTRVQRQK